MAGEEEGAVAVPQQLGAQVFRRTAAADARVHCVHHVHRLVGGLFAREGGVVDVSVKSVRGAGRIAWVRTGSDSVGERADLRAIATGRHNITTEVRRAVTAASGVTCGSGKLLGLQTKMSVSRCGWSGDMPQSAPLLPPSAPLLPPEGITPSAGEAWRLGELGSRWAQLTQVGSLRGS